MSNASQYTVSTHIERNVGNVQAYRIQSTEYWLLLNISNLEYVNSYLLLLLKMDHMLESNRKRDIELHHELVIDLRFEV